MTKAGDKILAGARSALAFARGEDAPGVRVHVPHPIDTKRIRTRLGLTQEQFAEQYGFAVATVRDWEQGRAMPDKATRTLIIVIDLAPEVVRKAVHGALDEIAVMEGRATKLGFGNVRDTVRGDTFAMKEMQHAHGPLTDYTKKVAARAKGQFLSTSMGAVAVKGKQARGAKDLAGSVLATGGKRVAKRAPSKRAHKS
jgi:putative transcriptional regulator